MEWLVRGYYSPFLTIYYMTIMESAYSYLFGLQLFCANLSVLSQNLSQNRFLSHAI